MDKLKPGPFCGSPVKSVKLTDSTGYVTSIYCTNTPRCGAIVVFAGNERKKKAVAAWNARAARPDNWIKFETEDETYTNAIPDDEQDVLVTDGKRVWQDTFLNDGSEGCYLDSGFEIVPNVTHWQPLPEPPKMKGE